jgi:chemotaxis protein methyltransferase CheR
MEELILKRISGLIKAHSGIHVREQDYQALSDKVWKRARHLGMNSLAGYYNFLLKELESGIGTTAQANSDLKSLTQPSEWQELYAILTINESYFFRDKNQFKLLAEKLLPEIISKKQAKLNPDKLHYSEADHPKPSLRIWSAGCSTGEELYSVAILLEEMHFPWQQWDTLLIGTDLSKPALATAQKGIYGGWSFRQVPDEIQQKYFCLYNNLFKIKDSIRHRVRFAYGNLLKDPFPNLQGDLHGMDLILCRNVFIYLDGSAISQIIDKFQATMAVHGVLLTGHTELYGQDVSQFQVLSFPESVVYKQRPKSLQPLLEVPPKPIQPHRYQSKRLLVGAAKRQVSRPQRSSRLIQMPFIEKPSFQTNLQNNWQSDLEKTERLLRQEAYVSAIASAEKIFAADPQCDAAVKIAAHAYANIGSYDQAKSLCQRVLKSQPLNVDMYYLLAQIAEEQNELDITKEYLQKIIYLDSSFVKAYLDLASIYEREKQIEKTKTMRTSALSLLNKLPADTILDTHTGITVGELKQYLEAKIPGDKG